MRELCSVVAVMLHVLLLLYVSLLYCVVIVVCRTALTVRGRSMIEVGVSMPSASLRSASIH
eukprot:COSAG06_NODE_28420_length_574_cov_3.320000_2_plen_60_part_01